MARVTSKSDKFKNDKKNLTNMARVWLLSTSHILKVKACPPTRRLM